MPHKSSKKSFKDLKDKEFLTLNEAAAFVHRAKTFVRSGLESGRLRGNRIGNRWSIWKQDLIDWIRTYNEQSA